MWLASDSKWDHDQSRLKRKVTTQVLQIRPLRQTAQENAKKNDAASKQQELGAETQMFGVLVGVGRVVCAVSLMVVVLASLRGNRKETGLSCEYYLLEKRNEEILMFHDFSFRIK